MKQMVIPRGTMRKCRRDVQGGMGLYRQKLSAEQKQQIRDIASQSYASIRARRIALPEFADKRKRLAELAKSA